MKKVFRETGLKGKDVAKKAGISGSFFSELLAGKKLPSLRTAVAIEAATDGKLPVTAWITEDAQP